MKAPFPSGAALLCLAMLCTGCATTGFFKSTEKLPREAARNPVARILTMWQPSEGMWGGKITRGVEGQILFFGLNDSLAMQVSGDAVIDVFDDQGTSEEQAKPIHEFRIEKGAWQAHMAKGPLGATYDVFIPYTRKGSHEARLTLLVRYKSKEGTTLDSDMVDIILEGTKKSRPADSEPAEYGRHAPVSKDAGAAQSSLIELARQPRREAADVAVPMPTPEQLDLIRGKRPASAPLTAQERKRILREAHATLDVPQRSSVQQASYEEPAAASQENEDFGDADDEFEPETRNSRAKKPAANALIREPELSDEEW